jgi:hypothetical protein
MDRRGRMVLLDHKDRKGLKGRRDPLVIRVLMAIKAR